MEEPEPGARGEQSATSRGLLLKWPALSLALGVIAAACLGTLVVVSTVKNVDVLSTVALALAVISFAAQVVVSLAQGQASGSQLAQAERTHNETRSLLAEISVRAVSLLANQSQQFDRVLEAALAPGALQRAIAEATPEDQNGTSEDDSSQETHQIDADALSATIVENIRSAFRMQPELTLGTTPVTAKVPTTSRTLDLNQYNEFVEELTTYPEEAEGRPAVDVLNAMSPFEVGLFVRRASEDLTRARRGAPPHGFVDDLADVGTVTTRIVERGLFELTPTVQHGRARYARRLTPLGRTIAGLIFGKGAAPEWLTTERDRVR